MAAAAAGSGVCVRVNVHGGIWVPPGVSATGAGLLVLEVFVDAQLVEGLATTVTSFSLKVTLKLKVVFFLSNITTKTNSEHRSQEQFSVFVLKNVVNSNIVLGPRKTRSSCLT